MFQFFNYVIDFIQSIIAFIGNIIAGIIEAFLLLPKGVAYVFSALAYMPTVVVPFMLASLALMVTFFIINHGGN